MNLVARVDIKSCAGDHLLGDGVRCTALTCGAAVGESYRQLLGLRLLRTLAELGVFQVRDRAALASVEPMSDDPLSDVRFGWPSPHLPELVEVSWPAPNLPREPLEQPELRISPWALHSLMLGDWGALVPGTALRLPECIALLLCDGLTENPAGRDLLRVPGQLELLSFPTPLHSQIIVCGLANGVGLMEVEIQVIGPDDSEVGFAVKRLSCPSKEIATFYVAKLDDLEVHEAGHYWFVLRMLGQESAERGGPQVAGTRSGSSVYERLLRGRGRSGIGPDR